MNISELQKMTVIKLREKAGEFADLKGVSSMKKDKLIKELCSRLGIEPAKMTTRPPEGKEELKKKIKELKLGKQEAISRQDFENAILYRKKIRTCKRKLRKALRIS